MKAEERWLPLTNAEAEQLLAYVEQVERKGWYYGDKRWFEKRHQHIKHCLENMLLKNITTHP